MNNAGKMETWRVQDGVRRKVIGKCQKGNKRKEKGNWEIIDRK